MRGCFFEGIHASDKPFYYLDRSGNATSLPLINEYNTTFSGVDYTIAAVFPADANYNLQRVADQEPIAKAIVDAQDVLNSLTPGDPARADALALIEQLNKDWTNLAQRDTPFYKKFAEIQTLSISTRRSVNPVRRLGETDPAYYVRGPRSTAGSMVFAELNGDVFLDLFRRTHYDPVGNEPYFAADRIPPFNILISGMNEYGHVVEGALFGVTLVAQGKVLSVDDLYTESQTTYVALHYSPVGPRPLKERVIGEVGRAFISNGMGAASSLDNNNKATSAHLDALYNTLTTVPKPSKDPTPIVD